MFRRFERLINPTAEPKEQDPPTGVWAFYWFYVSQVRALVAALIACGLVVALLDTLVPVFIGRAVSLAASTDPARTLRDNATGLALMAATLLLARPAALITQFLLTNQAIAPGLTNLIRWQSHFHVVRQSWTFFQNDFAGRIANRVMQTGPALRESVVTSSSAVLYIAVYGTSATILEARSDWRLALPTIAWFALYALLLRIAIPRMRERSRAMSEVRSALTGRVVDSYTNILTVKLFARPRDEDQFVRDGVDLHTSTFHRQLRMITGVASILTCLNAMLLVSTGALALSLWARGHIGGGTIAMALPLTWQIVTMSGTIAQNITVIFENVGIVQDGMRSIAVPRQHADRAEAARLNVGGGGIEFQRVRFGYGTERGVLHGLDLRIEPGERVGLVGHSGAGKSTLVHLLLGFYALEGGRILIDGQDLAGVTQESLRGAIAMVTQDTSLLHRSILENIRYGRPSASEAEARAAAAQAQALGFIETLEDWQGRTGFDAHVGERGVKLSGGQRQRIAIARVILKAAPILVLDEATSALDSEVEAAIAEQLDGLMAGRTVLAIAHRLSTLSRMDRIVVLDHGRIAEEGSHAALLRKDGAYARLWRRQAGAMAELG